MLKQFYNLAEQGRLRATWSRLFPVEGCRTSRRLPGDFLDHRPVDFRQAFLASKVRIRQIILIESELVENRRVQVSKMERSLDTSQADIVGRPDDLSATDSSAIHA